MTTSSALLVTRELIESDQWHEWLDAHDKFKFENGCHLSRDTKFTAYKSRTGHWTAQRRMHGHLRHQYLGKPQDMTYEKLQAVAEKLAIVSKTAYESELKTTLRKADKELLAELRPDTSAFAKSHKTESVDYETQRALTLQATEEVAKLKAELERVTQHRDKFSTEVDNLEKQLEKERRANQQLSTLDLINLYETDYETIKKTLPKPTVTRDWVHFQRFKNWLESRGGR